MSKAKSIGTAFETQVVKYLQSRDLDAYRITMGGANDKGDVWVRRSDGRVTILECKAGKQTHNASPQQERTWYAEAEREAIHAGARGDVGAVVMKRKGAGEAKAAEHDVIIDIADLNHLLGIGQKHVGALTVRIRLAEFAAALKVAGY